jgi:RHS repeat-associated protein
VGNLAAVTQPNGVVHAYTYDTRNRLTQLAVNAGGGAGPALASYAYTLAPTGHRLSVAELSGRTVTYTYDDLYRLTSETIAGDTSSPTPQNGVISYTYDAVGNRQQRGSTVPAIPAIPAGVLFYDANDRLTGGAESYDANGNTVANAGFSVAYDFENRIVSRDDPTVANDTISIKYNGDGQRVEKSVQTGPSTFVVTRYLVDDRNPTGFEQVLVETVVGQFAQRQYVYGLDLISQRRQLTFNTFENRYYGYDGHGSVRQLTDAAGAVTDTYTYDAFGNLISQAFTGAAPTPNHYLYAGEQFDSDLGLYYNRARYLDVRTGRFWSMDPMEGLLLDPLSLHKYVYAHASPSTHLDTTGFLTQKFGYAVEREVQPQYEATHLGDLVSYGQWGRIGPNFRLKPDLLNFTTMTWLDIKPFSISGVIRAFATWSLYSGNFGVVGFNPDAVWVPPAQPIMIGRLPILVFNVQGILFYTDAFDSVEDLAILKAYKTIPQLIRLLSRAGGKLSEPGRIRALVQLATRAVQATLSQIRGLVTISAQLQKF